MQSVRITTDKENRIDFKKRLLSQIETALVPPSPVTESEPVEVEILDKYSQWIPVRLAIEPEDELLPEHKRKEPFVLQGEIDKRVSAKNAILNKVESSISPTIKSEIEKPVEVIEKFANWAPARVTLEPMDEFPLEFKKDKEFISDSDRVKRTSIKKIILDKVESSLVEPVIEEPKEVEIIEKYSQWVPTRLSIQLDEELPSGSSEKIPFTPYSELEKRTSIKSNLSNKIESALTPVPEIEPVPIEIIEKYSEWTSARIAIQLEESLEPEFKKEALFIPEGDLEKRVGIKHLIMSKVENALTPVPEIEPVPVEIIDKYSKWVPANLAIEPEDGLLPESKKEAAFIPVREIDKRASIKKGMLNKLEAVLNPEPQVIQEPEPIEIINKYINWAPARVSLKPEDGLLPEFKKEEAFIPAREIEKRASVKNKILGQIEHVLVPPISEPEPVSEPVEIIGEFSSGIPQRVTKDIDPFFSETRVDVQPGIIDRDVPKRQNFKKKLFKKVDLGSIEKGVEKSPVEIVGYSQRPVNSTGFDFPEIKLPTLEDTQRTSETVSLETIETVSEDVIPVLFLPENYPELDERALYGLLIRDPELKHTSDTANLALDVLAGRSSETVEFTIITKPKLQPKKTRVRKTVKTEAITEIPVVEDVVEAPVTMAVGPIVEEVPEVININLPIDWENIPLSVLRTDLLSTGATPEQVDAKLAELVKPEEVCECSVDSDTMVDEEIVLPEEFISWKPNSQYIYLTNQVKLTSEKANKIIWELRV